MNGYDYYEFLAIDHPVSPRDQRELHALAPHAATTATRFCTGYGASALPGDPQVLLARHFDVLVHLTDAGARELMIRLPRSQTDVETLRRYLRGDSASFDTIGEAVILDLWSDLDDPDDWAEGEGWMAALAPVREDLLRGDCRPLYLAWLLCAQSGDSEDDAAEPTLPYGLGELTGAQLELASFLRLDEDLVGAAAEPSPSATVDPAQIRSWVCQLTSAQKDALLAEALLGQPERVVADLRRRFGSPGVSFAAPRTVAALGEQAGSRRAERDRNEARRRQRKLRALSIPPRVAPRR